MNPAPRFSASLFAAPSAPFVLHLIAPLPRSATCLPVAVHPAMNVAHDYRCLTSCPGLEQTFSPLLWEMSTAVTPIKIRVWTSFDLAMCRRQHLVRHAHHLSEFTPHR